MQVRHISQGILDCEHREALCRVLLQLRPQYETVDRLLEQIDRQQREESYELAYVVAGDESSGSESAAEVFSVAGFVIAEKLAWGKHLYIDDLITSQTERSRGAGRLLIDWCRRYALEKDCRELHLDSGVQRFAAHRFYLREGFRISSHHFSIENLKNPSPY